MSGQGNVRRRKGTSEQRTERSYDAGLPERLEFSRRYPDDMEWDLALDGVTGISPHGLPVVCVKPSDSDLSRLLSVGCNTATAPNIRGWRRGFLDQLRGNTGVCMLSLFPFPPGHPLYDVPGAWPNFVPWMCARVWYPTQDGSTYRLGDGTHRVSPSQMVELYLSALLGMMGEFFNDPTEDNVSLLDCFRRTVENFIRLEKFSGVKAADVATAYEHMERLQRLIEKRDASSEDAKAYQQFIDDTPPQIIAFMQYNIACFAPELMERSVTTSLGNFIMGLMTQSLLGESGINVDGVAEILLRMILERAARKVSAINTNDCFDLPSLVRAVHERAGIHVERELRWWTFVVEVLRYVFLRPPMQSRQATRALLMQIRERVMAMQGITSFCATIAPEAGLTDETIAEILLRASQMRNKSRMVLGMHALVTKTTTAALDAEVRKNRDRRDEVQSATEAAGQKLLCRQMEAARLASAGEVVRQDDEYALLQESARSRSHVHDATEHSRIMREMAAICASGDVAAIQSLLDGATADDGSKILGPQRIRYLVRARASREVLSELHLRPLTKHEIGGTNPIQALLRDLASGGGSAAPVVHVSAAPVEVVSDEPVQEILFVPMSEAVARAAVHRAAVVAAAVVAAAQQDCIVCMEAHDASALVNPCAEGGNTHADDTKICRDCKGRLDLCPICRHRYHHGAGGGDSSGAESDSDREEYRY